jgi:RNA polymerase sigma-54 factor
MKQSLQLRLGQSLTMTPQLQQAIKLLQLSTLDLQQEIQLVLDSNMMLEVAEDEKFGFSETAEQTSNEHENRDNIEYGEIPNLDEVADIPRELATDTSWDDVYDSVQSYTTSQQDSDTDDLVFQRARSQTLQDHLIWQMELTPFSDIDRAIATAIIDAIDDDGYLTLTVPDIHQGLIQQIDDLDLDEVLAVLHRIQQFDPAGVGAVDLADCLTIQLRQLPNDTHIKSIAIRLASEHLELLAKKDLIRLKRNLNIGDEELADTIAIIRTLEPKPGRRIHNQDPQYVIPDVFVTKIAGDWVVSLNPEIAPKLRVNPFYSNLIKRADQSADNVCMKNHLQEARWFIKSLQSRNETLIKVAKSIVEHQKEFLELGDKAMKPLVLRDVAEEVEMHESTISRVTTQKFMHTPNGVYEFKYFFSSHVSTDEGGECSATAIKAFIKELVDTEDGNKPLSDHAISSALKDKGINVARRTIAKYREALSIPPSNERKRVF